MEQNPQTIKDSLLEILNNQLIVAEQRKTEVSDKRIVYFPELFLTIDLVNNTPIVSNNLITPKLFTVEEANNLTQTVYNGRKKRPVSSHVHSFYKKVIPFIKEQIEYVNNISIQ